MTSGAYFHCFKASVADLSSKGLRLRTTLTDSTEPSPSTTASTMTTPRGMTLWKGNRALHGSLARHLYGRSCFAKARSSQRESPDWAGTATLPHAFRTTGLSWPQTGREEG